MAKKEKKVVAGREIKMIGTRKDLIRKLLRILANESGNRSCRMFFVRQERLVRSEDSPNEKMVVGTFRKIT